MTVPSWAQCDLGTLQIPNGFCPRTGGQNLEGPKKKIRWGFLTMVSSRSPINPLWFSWHILTQSTTRSRFWRWEIIYIYYYIQYIHVIYTGAFHNMYLRYICNVCLYVYTYIYIHVYYRGKAWGSPEHWGTLSHLESCHLLIHVWPCNTQVGGWVGCVITFFERRWKKDVVTLKMLLRWRCC